jgi:hypothetical protein
MAIQRPRDLQLPAPTCQEGARLGTTKRPTSLSRAPSPPSIYYTHHRGNDVVQDTVHTRPNSPPNLHNYLPVLGGQPTRAPSLDKLSRAAVRTKKKPAAAQPRNSPQELQLQTAALEVGYALSTIPYPCRCGQRPVHRPGTGSLHPHRPPRAARKGKETKLRPNKNSPPSTSGASPPCIL